MVIFALVYFVMLMMVVLERPQPGGRGRHRRDLTGQTR